MGNILDYVRTYGNETFAERHFSSADALVLAQLSYMDWSSAVPQIKDSKDFISLHETLYIGDLEPMIRGSVFKEENRALYYQTVNSRRFGEIKLNFYTEINSNDQNLQLSAVTFLLPCNRACVAFRGTDESLNGWRESFSMVYRFPVPAQEYAATYLQQVAERLKCPLIVCGHSKGGNLAVYASVKNSEFVRNRICRIYNFDGPGFWDEFLEDKAYRSMKDKIRKYVAPESFIGLLLKDDIHSFMVQCRQHGMEQHDPYQWELFHGRLRKACRYKQERRDYGEQLNTRILAVSKDKAQVVIDSFFKATEDSGLKKLSEIKADHALEILHNFRDNHMYDRESMIVLARLLIYMLPGRKILR